MVNFNSALTTSGAAAAGQVSQQRTNIAADPAIAATLAALGKLNAATNVRLNDKVGTVSKNLEAGLRTLSDPMANAARQTFLKK